MAIQIMKLSKIFVFESSPLFYIFQKCKWILGWPISNIVPFVQKDSHFAFLLRNFIQQRSAHFGPQTKFCHRVGNNSTLPKLIFFCKEHGHVHFAGPRRINIFITEFCKDLNKWRFKDIMSEKRWKGIRAHPNWIASVFVEFTTRRMVSHCRGEKWLLFYSLFLAISPRYSPLAGPIAYNIS